MANEVLINSSAADALTNLKRAIDRTGTPGTDYGSDTIEHTQVDGSTLTSTALTVVATVAGSSSNSYTTTATGTGMSWTDPTLINGGWASATGTINGCAYTNDTTVTLTATPTTTGQNGVYHRCEIRNAAGPATFTDPALLTITSS